jgi:hypothetical protein
MRSFRIPRLVLLGGLLLGLASCKKNPIDEVLDEVLDFSGAFETDNGMLIEVDVPAGRAVIRRFGTSPFSSSLKLGEDFIVGMFPNGENKYRGYVRGRNGLFDWSDITVNGSELTFSNTLAGHERWRKAVYTPPSTPTGGGGTPATGTRTILLSEGGLQGNERSAKTYKVTVGTGVKSLEVVLSEETGGRQLADLFVKKGSAPTASHYPYVWTADCVGVEPNRETERCVIPNPSGEYHILVYGYHEYWGTKLTVTAVR